MAHVGAEVGRPAQAHLRVHVGPVHVDLPAVRVHDLADLADRRLEDAVGRWIGDHQRGERVAVLGGLGAEVGDVNVAARVGLHGDHREPGHHRARGIGAVCRGGDEARGAIAFAARAVVRPDHEQPGELPLGSGVGLERHAREPRDLGQHVLELAEQGAVARGLLARREGVQPVEFAPRERHHLGGGVELHRARAERDHRRREGEVARLEPFDVAQHLGLGAVAVEHRMREVRRGAPQPFGDRGVRLRAQVFHHEREDLVEREGRDQVGEVAQAGGLVERDPEAGGGDRAQVDAAGPRGVDETRQRPRLDLDAQRVKELRVHDAIAEPHDGLGEQHREHVHPLGDAPQALGTVVHGVHAGHHGEQHLRGADVRRRLFAADVLLSRLQRHAQRRAARRVLRHADDAPGHVTLVLLPRREKRGVGTAVPHRHAEPLRVADRDVGAPFPGRREQREREQVRRHGDERSRRVGPLDERAVVLDPAVRRGILEQRPDHAGSELEARRICDDGLHAARLGARPHDGDRLGVAPFRDHEHRRHAGGRLRHGLGQVHRFGGRGGFVEEGGVGDRKGGEVGDHRLEVEQRLEPALRDLGLVRGVGRVPARVLDDVALDHLRGEGMVVPHPDIRPVQLVLGGEAAQRLEHLPLGPARRQRERPAQPDVVGHDGVDEGVERVVAEGAEHGPGFVGAGPHVTGLEAIGRGERGADGGHDDGRR